MADSKARKIDTEAGVAGASGGTGLIGLANLLPTDLAWLKSVILYTSPSATVGIALLWALAAAWLRAWYTKDQLDRAIAEACKTRDGIHNSPMASQAHKDNAQQNVEKLESLKFELLDEQFSAVRATLKSNGS